MNIYLISIYIIFILLSYQVMNKVLRRNVDIFSPYSFFIIYVALEVPYLFKVNSDKSNIPEYALLHINNFDSVFLLHIVNSVIFCLFTFIVFIFYKPKKTMIVQLYKFKTDNTKLLLKMHFILLFTGIVSYLLFLNSIGGIVKLLSSLDSKNNLIQGTGYFQAIYGVSLFCSTGFLIKAIAGSVNKQILTRYLPVVVFFTFLILATIGSRKVPILYILYSIVMWNYCVRRVNFLKPKYIVFAFIGLMYFSIMPLFRVAGAWDYYVSNLPELFNAAFEKIFSFFDRFSDIDRSLLIYSIFDFDNLWWGSSFKDLLYAPIPRGMFPEKPPTDSGVYIYNLAHGYDYTPTTPFSKMLPVGWPLSSITNMYVNFWFPGVILAGLINGAILIYFYRAVLNSNFNPVLVYIYVSIIFGDFALTNIKLVSFATKIVFTFLIIKLIYELFGKKIKWNAR